ncbi:MAG: hypothetical protein WC824_15315 [Bacteroidota bacterium]
MNMLTKRSSSDVVASGSEHTAHRPFRTRIPGYTIRVLALIGIALLIWKLMAVSALESRHEDALQALRDSTTQRITERTMLLARTAGESVGLSITPALRQGNIEGVRSLCTTLAQRSAVSDYIVSNAQGVVVAAMNVRMEGELLEANLRRAAASLDESLADTIENGLTRVIVPLRDGAGEVGTVILTFRLP